MSRKARTRDSTSACSPSAPARSTASCASSPTRRSSCRSRIWSCRDRSGTTPSALIKELLRSYRRTLAHQHHPLEEFRYVHTARKVVGVGSVGTRCYILLLVGT